MIKSMTGYGKAIANIGNKKFTVEMRSLNSKQLDLSVRMPGVYREKELEVRNELSKLTDRGKIEFSIYCETQGEDSGNTINKNIAIGYFKQIKELASELQINLNDEVIHTVLRMPDVMKTERQELDETEWKEVWKIAKEAISKFDNFRLTEGKTLQKEVSDRINLILDLLTQVEPYEIARMETVKERINKSLADFVGNENVDKNRFEQELIYYMEKLDISEEKLRLKTHCDYFNETMNNETNQGRKLGFITQEIGREINTLGSKSNQADMQKIVVRMKDELEKIKEQILNVL
jgi:uncharacterized protein (TIGR00255 family)